MSLEHGAAGESSLGARGRSCDGFLAKVVFYYQTTPFALRTDALRTDADDTVSTARSAGQ